MDKIISEIQKLADVPSYSKHDRFVNGIINAINEKILVSGDGLPSVNTLIKELGFARETIMKGYKELTGRGIIEVRSRLGYFVSGASTEQTLNVALIMYNLDTFEEQFYRNFRHQLGKHIALSTYFHHGNIEIFETIVNQIKGKYGMYVIAPIPHMKTREILEPIPDNKLLMFDRYEPLDRDVNYITQEFENSTYEVLVKLYPRISKYKEFVFFHSPNSLDPKEMVNSFKRFIADYQISGRILKEYKNGSIQKNTAYFTLDNFALWQIMRDCKSKDLEPGRDVGILSCNDEPAKEIVGITTFSADFSDMGAKAGKAIVSKKNLKLTVPMLLFERSTL